MNFSKLRHQNMKNYLLILAVLVMVGCGRQSIERPVSETWLHSQDTIHIRYKQLVENYKILGYATTVIDTTSEFWGAYCINLEFYNVITKNKFQVAAGYISDYLLMMHGKILDNCLYLEYPTIEETGCVTVPDIPPFIFVDLDFDKKKELVTDYAPWAGVKHGGKFQSIYKIRQDSLYAMRIDLRTPAYGEDRIGYEIEGDHLCINYSTKEIFRNLSTQCEIYKLSESYSIMPPFLVVQAYSLSRRITAENFRTISIEYNIDNEDENVLTQLSSLSLDSLVNFGRLPFEIGESK